MVFVTLFNEIPPRLLSWSVETSCLTSCKLQRASQKVSNTKELVSESDSLKPISDGLLAICL